MKVPAILTTGSVLLTAGVSAIAPTTFMRLVPPPMKIAENEFASTLIQSRDADPLPIRGNDTFQQLLDHSDPSKGTFSQSYWWSTEYWQGPGSPVIFFTPGEIAAAEYTGYLTNRTLTGLLAQELGAATVLVEHRYWGDSIPYDTLTTENLAYLNLENSIHDTTYFANNVKFPFATNASSNADSVPWVFVGGSYSAALAGAVENVDPGTFWAYHASSATVQNIYDFWQYFAPVQEGMPTNCSADVSKVIEHIDSILLGDDEQAKQALKEKFGLGGIVHDDDFASALQNGPWLWQAHDVSSGYSDFFLFCDSVENVGPLYPNSTEVPGAEGVGLEKALEGYANWVKTELLPGYCAGYGYDVWTKPDEVGCFDTYDETSPFFTDIASTNDINRQWTWMLCNEPIAFWQTGAPEGTPTIVSRLVTAEYWQRQCPLYFTPPGTFGSAEGKTVEDTNKYTGGWDRAGKTTRLLFVNGRWDPWKDATVSSEFRPGGAFEGTADAPVLLIPEGIHCSDLFIRNGALNAGVKAVQDTAIETMVKWVGEFDVWKAQAEKTARRRL
ncbi:serine carboxypeptidase S28 [Diaporthe helianthi]|uniref:Serine carboxypeptidase S28 n=1 Tax=Diaporthe helianthi TaxID=158607 RepID=A0A2P5HV58_DIAHE|nr:serine carboxypeptidase S28 [Diaporthe helianthi]